MKIAIVGYGKEGRSAQEYWPSDTNQLTICDQDENLVLPDGVDRQLGSEYLRNLDRFDLIVRTAGLNPSDIVSANSPAILSKVTTVINEFFKVCPSKNIIGITGTKGKGTTASLVAKMLTSAGKTVHLGGNIGVSVLELLKQDIKLDDWVVLELSSFQLIDFKYAPAIGVCLMVVPEHLNWHADIDEYLTAKSHLFAQQTAEGKAIYFAGSETSKQIASAGNGQKIPYYASPGAIVDGNKVSLGQQTICEVSELKLLGQHNWQNACAAVTAVWQVTQDVQAIRQGLITFTGLPHRLELVRELDSIKYYDDSFGTTPETAEVAIEAIKEPKVLILGGSDKGASYDALAKLVTESNVKTVVLIGLTAPAIRASLEKHGYANIVSGGKTMPEIVKTCRSSASPGDAVLLSTACASFDMFRNYEDRGDQFKRAVQALA